MKNRAIKPEQLKILICCHKNCDLPRNDYLLPIHVGSSNSSLKLDMQRDDEVQGKTCDNISAKNPNYCELTAMYWAWKNLKNLLPEIEYIGLNHYRRYFALGEKVRFNDKIFIPESQIDEYQFNIDYLSRKLDQNTVFVATEKRYPYSLAVDYSSWNLCKDLRVLYKVIRDLYPEYEAAFLDKMCRSNSFSMYNMFIMPWAEFEAYCEWLFEILFETEARIDISSYESNYARIYGYMAERLLNVWLVGRKTRVLHSPVFFYADSIAMASAPSVGRSIIREFRSRMSFVFNKPLSQNNYDKFFKYPNG